MEARSISAGIMVMLVFKLKWWRCTSAALWKYCRNVRIAAKEFRAWRPSLMHELKQSNRRECSSENPNPIACRHGCVDRSGSSCITGAGARGRDLLQIAGEERARRGVLQR